MLAANVVYDREMWDSLVETIKGLSGRSTLVVIANVQRPKLDAGPFYETLSKEFEMKMLSQSALHPAFRRHGVYSCIIHVLRWKEASKERKWGSKWDGRMNDCTKEKVKRNRHDESAAAQEEERHGDTAVLKRQRRSATWAAAAPVEVEQEFDSVEAKIRRKTAQLRAILAAEATSAAAVEASMASEDLA